ncbi:MAG: hypothetical protein CMO74_12315 [Verrucomicrobiales bacterium]|nr:hypothetical protein [Verrucomicrobiales bacterium]|tara:strand:+ start:4370 stop:4654 length:285 start_codon:yes stop_codon:yes gene_type:complete
MADALIEALSENNGDMVVALKSIVSAEVRVVLEGGDVVGLNLDDTKVSDEALAQLHGLAKLRWIGLVRTEVTADGVEALRKALPGCTVLADLPK